MAEFATGGLERFQLVDGMRFVGRGIPRRGIAAGGFIHGREEREAPALTMIPMGSIATGGSRGWTCYHGNT
jgi:hypothetical protein